MKSNRKLVSPLKPSVVKAARRRHLLRLGFLPENDCAPVVVAQEFGLFQRYGLNVELSSQASWKHLHNKFHLGLLEVAHAPAMLPFLMSLGLTPEKCECVTGLVLSLQGNAITVSQDLWRLGVCDGQSMNAHLRQDRGRRSYTFGVAAPLSPQYFLLCHWLKSANIPPHAVRIESAPTEQLFPLLKLGYLDGYCAGEPWGTIASQAGVGQCVATSAQLAPLHPEKVLMARKSFAEECPEEHERLIAALVEACFLCDQPENRPVLAGLLAQPRFVNAPPECLEPGLVGPFGARESPVHGLYGLNLFHRANANAPTAAKAAWLTGRLYEFLRWSSRPPGLSKVFRLDLYRRALRLAPAELRTGSPTAPLERRQARGTPARPLAVSC